MAFRTIKELAAVEVPDSTNILKLRIVELTDKAGEVTGRKLDVRGFWLHQASGVYKPGRNGLMLDANTGLNTLLRACQEGLAELSESGPITEGAKATKVPRKKAAKLAKPDPQESVEAEPDDTEKERPNARARRVGRRVGKAAAK